MCRRDKGALALAVLLSVDQTHPNLLERARCLVRHLSSLRASRFKGLKNSSQAQLLGALAILHTGHGRRPLRLSRDEPHHNVRRLCVLLTLPSSAVPAGLGLLFRRWRRSCCRAATMSSSWWIMNLLVRHYEPQADRQHSPKPPAERPAGLRRPHV